MGSIEETVALLDDVYVDRNVANDLVGFEVLITDFQGDPSS